MRFGAYVMLMFSIALVMYLLGFQSILLYIWTNQNENALEHKDVLTEIAHSITSEEGLQLLLGIAVIGVVATLLGGFGATFLVPLLILLVVLNYVVFPISFLIDPNVPAIIRIPAIIFINILTILSILDFIRGRV